MGIKFILPLTVMASTTHRAKVAGQLPPWGMTKKISEKRGFYLNLISYQVAEGVQQRHVRSPYGRVAHAGEEGHHRHKHAVGEDLEDKYYNSKKYSLLFGKSLHLVRHKDEND